MKEFSGIIHFNSVAEFEAVYRLVKEEVLLFDSFSGAILAANYSFWQHEAQNPGFMVEELTGFPFREDGSYEQVREATGGEGALFTFDVLSVKLADNGVRLGFIQKQLNEAIMERRLRLEENEKKALLNEVYHRVKNNLNIMVSLLSLQINRATDAKTRHLLLESKSRIYTLSLLQQKLYSSPRVTEIKTGHYLQSLALSVISTFKPSGKNISLNVDVKEEWLNMETLIPVGLITHELVSNAVLHAFHQQVKAEIIINFQNEDTGFYLLKIADNGSGLPENARPENSGTLGFQLVNSLLRQLKAEWHFESVVHQGTRYSIKFKEILK